MEEKRSKKWQVIEERFIDKKKVLTTTKSRRHFFSLTYCEFYPRQIERF